MSEIVDAFVNDVTRAIRRSIYQRLKERGFSQDELTAVVSTATRAALQRAGVRDLAALASAGAQVAATYEAALPPGDPLPPSLESWKVTRDSSPERIRPLLEIS
ncbi:MAG: hypothetical protein ACK4Z5_12180 [Brevundimonas sp.]